MSLRKVQKSPTAIQKLLQKTTKKSSKRSDNIKKLPSGLIDHPETYLAPKETFIVARNNKKKLNSKDYRSLAAAEDLSIETINFILRMLIIRNGNKIIRYDLSIDKFNFASINKWRETNQLCFFINKANQKCSLSIVDVRNQIFFYVDPLDCAAECNEVFAAFQNFLDPIPDTTREFKQNNIQYDTTNSTVDSSVAVIYFIDQYLKTQTINAPFNATEYRSELQHLILRSSTNMSKSCIM